MQLTASFYGARRAIVRLSRYARPIKEEELAIKFNVSQMNGPAFLAKVGIAPQGIAKLLADGWKVTLTAGFVEFRRPLPDDPAMFTCNTVPVNPVILGTVQAGTTPPDKLAALRDALAGAIYECFTHGDAKSMALALSGDGLEFQVNAAPKAKSTTQPTPKAKPTLPAKAWTSFDTTKMKWATPVKLTDATQMYQPVYGTSGGSRYFVVAANKDLRIAARFQGGSLSVRIEGPGLDKNTGAIVQCGFDMHLPGKNYASLHLSVGGDPVLANKTLGAVLLGLGLPLETPIPDTSLIKAAS